MSEAKPLAFILMPFDADFADVYTELIQTPLEAAGFEVRRADSLLNQRSVLQDVIRGIADAALVVADVSGLNPNVMYELGLAHALGQRTIMITRDIDELPFDLRPYRANPYSTRFTEAGEIVKTLREIGEAVLVGSAQFSNPVQDFAPDALISSSQVNVSPKPRETADRVTVKPENAGDSDDDDSEPGLIEYAVAMQEGSERSVGVMARISAATNDVGASMEARTEQMEKVQKNLGDKGAGMYLKIMRDSAADLDRYTEAVGPANVELRTSVMSVAEAATGLARVRTVDTDEDYESLLEDIEAIRDAETAMVEAFFSVTEFAQGLLDLPHMDRKLTQAARRAASVVSETAEITEIAQAEYARARQLLEERAARAARS